MKISFYKTVWIKANIFLFHSLNHYFPLLFELVLLRSLSSCLYWLINCSNMLASPSPWFTMSSARLASSSINSLSSLLRLFVDFPDFFCISLISFLDLACDDPLWLLWLSAFCLCFPLDSPFLDFLWLSTFRTSGGGSWLCWCYTLLSTVSSTSFLLSRVSQDWCSGSGIVWLGRKPSPPIA